MNLQQLEYILAVDSLRHFAKAAEHCKVTQPTLSAMIQKLEEELKIKIFDRSTQPVRPTEVGKRILRQARIVIHESSLIKDIVQEETKNIEGKFRIAVLPTIAPYLLPRFFSKVVEQHPKLDLQVIEMKTPQCLSAILSGGVEAAILATSTNDKDLLSQPLFYEQFFAYVSRKEPAFKNELVKTSDINGKRLWLLGEGHCFRDQLIRFCQLESTQNSRNAYRLGSMETFMRMVEGGEGITFIPELAVMQLSSEQKQLVRPFAIPRPVRRIDMVTRKDFVRHSILDLLSNYIKESVPTTMWSLQHGQKTV